MVSGNESEKNWNDGYFTMFCEAAVTDNESKALSALLSLLLSVIFSLSILHRILKK